jgi:hypothetical protein
VHGSQWAMHLVVFEDVSRGIIHETAAFYTPMEA